MGMGSADESGRFGTRNGQFMNMNNEVIKEEWKGGVPVVLPEPTMVLVITNVKFETTSSPENYLVRKRKSGFLPLEVDTRVLCKWRDGKFHLVNIIERHKLPNNGMTATKGSLLCNVNMNGMALKVLSIHGLDDNIGLIWRSKGDETKAFRSSSLPVINNPYLHDIAKGCKGLSESLIIYPI